MWTIAQIVVLLVAITTTVCSSAAVPMTLVPLTDNATLGISGAVCNDGTQAAFYWRQGTTRQYIVHLQGGYWCWDEPSCMDRALQSPELTSSSSYAPQPPSYIGSGGFLNPDPSRNPVWASANLAYVMYCSSDAFSGNTTTTLGGQPWRFYGLNVLHAVFAMLAGDARFGGMDWKDDIVLSGCSAGGQGVINAADYVRGFLPGLFGGTQPRSFKAMADAGWMMSPQPLFNSTLPMVDEFVSAAPMWGGSPNGQCKLSVSNSMLPLCYLSPFAWPHMSTPVFIQSSQYDAFQTPYNAGGGPPYSGASASYVESLRSLFYHSMQEVRAPSAVFSPSCYYHCISEDDNFFQFMIPDSKGHLVNMNQTFSAWYYASDPTVSYSVQSTCQGFNCGVGCPSQ